MNEQIQEVAVETVTNNSQFDAKSGLIGAAVLGAVEVAAGAGYLIYKKVSAGAKKAQEAGKEVIEKISEKKKENAKEEKK